MARLTKNQLNKLKEKYDVDTLWSFSRYNSYLTDSYSYLLNYVKHIKPNTKESIWGKSGGLVHDILESYYMGEIEYADMINKYEEGLFELDSEGFKYSKNDKDMNDNISKKYENSIRHFFLNYKPIEGKVMCEKFIVINIGKYYFQGYVDFMYKDKEDDKIVISDFKTSTIYTGEKAKKEAAQLLLYSIGVGQKLNIPLSKIKANWNFLKYVTVTSDLKSIDKTTGEHRKKQKNCLRCEWVKESKGNVKKWIEACGYDELEVEDILQSCIEKNSLEDYPEVAKHFELNDCYVYIDLTEENVNALCDKVEKTLKEVEEKTKATMEYLGMIKDSNDKEEINRLEKLIDEMWWVQISQKDMYYYYNLCSYDRKLHKPLNEYFLDSEMFIKQENKMESKSDNNDDLDEWDWD